MRMVLPTWIESHGGKKNWLVYGDAHRAVRTQDTSHVSKHTMHHEDISTRYYSSGTNTTIP
jgi:hypothetical protein